MDFDVITSQPDAFMGPLDSGVFGRGVRNGKIQIRLHDLRRFGIGPHRQLDDTPYGGGAGMVLKPEPLVEAVRWVKSTYPVQSDRVVMLTPQGKPFSQQVVKQCQSLDRLIFICGRYEGIDERVNELVVDEEWSIGDFVLTCGELAAMTMMDAIVRMIPGVLGNELSAQAESFEEGLLDYPHYTRPQVFEGLEVPSVLVGGDHQAILRWRQNAARKATKDKRPDLLAGKEQSDECDSSA